MKLPATVLSHLRSSVALGASLGALLGAGCDLGAVAPSDPDPYPESADQAPTAARDDAAPTGLAGTVARTVERNRATRPDPITTVPTLAPAVPVTDDEDPTAFVPFTADPEPVARARPRSELPKTKRRPPVATPSKGGEAWVCGPCGRG